VELLNPHRVQPINKNTNIYKYNQIPLAGKRPANMHLLLIIAVLHIYKKSKINDTLEITFAGVINGMV